MTRDSMISGCASRSINGLSGSHRSWVAGGHTDSSNPTASSGVDRYKTEPCKTPVICRLARLEKRLDWGCATRNATPQAPCTELHGRYRRPKELRRNAKNPGKTRVFGRGQDSNNPQNPWENRSLKTRRRKIRRALQNTPCAACCMRALRLSLGH